MQMLICTSNQTVHMPPSCVTSLSGDCHTNCACSSKIACHSACNQLPLLTYSALATRWDTGSTWQLFVLEKPLHLDLISLDQPLNEQKGTAGHAGASSWRTARHLGGGLRPIRVWTSNLRHGSPVVPEESRIPPVVLLHPFRGDCCGLFSVQPKHAGSWPL